MTAVDFAPAAGAAPVLRRIVSHSLIETKLLIRNGEQLLLALVIPIGVLVVGRFIGGRFGTPATLAPSVLALAVWSSAFTSVAIGTGFERRYGVLERLAATPLGKPGLLAGKAGSVVLVVVGQLAVVAVVAAITGWRPAWSVSSGLLMVLVVLLSIATFACLALALAGRLRAEATLGLANLIYVVLLAGGALVFPVLRYPVLVRPIVSALPTAALGEGLRAGSLGHTPLWPVMVLLIWLAISAAVAWRGFRWTS
jgi:ABC-2 type transport system permease protein